MRTRPRSILTDEKTGNLDQNIGVPSSSMELRNRINCPWLFGWVNSYATLHLTGQALAKRNSFDIVLHLIYDSGPWGGLAVQCGRST